MPNSLTSVVTSENTGISVSSESDSAGRKPHCSLPRRTTSALRPGHSFSVGGQDKNAINESMGAGRRRSTPGLAWPHTRERCPPPSNSSYIYMQPSICICPSTQTNIQHCCHLVVLARQLLALGTCFLRALKARLQLVQFCFVLVVEKEKVS